MTDETPPHPPAPKLRRVLTLGPLILYGLGIIVGAGIYVALGEVIARAGATTPVSFLVAGLAAGLTGLCYAEFGSRFPEAAGAAAYVRHGFGSDRLAQATGLAVTFAVAVAAASIAGGAAVYLAAIVPLPSGVLMAGIVAVFTLVAAIGVRESVGLAAAIGAIEIAGLVAAAAVGWVSAADPGAQVAAMLPRDGDALAGMLSGAFIAFFAFIGFESLSNLAEEVHDPRRTLPRGIVGAVALSILLYAAVATGAVVSGDFLGPSADAPLLDLFGAQGRAAAVAFAAVGFLAVANGVLVEIVMLARLFYGMADRGQLPAALARVDPRTRTPVHATALAGAIVLAVALFVPFERLLVLANAATLGIFALVALALWRVRRAGPAPAGAFTVPAWVPPLAAVLSVALMAAELVLGK